MISKSADIPIDSVSIFAFLVLRYPILEFLKNPFLASLYLILRTLWPPILGGMHYISKNSQTRIQTHLWFWTSPLRFPCFDLSSKIDLNQNIHYDTSRRSLCWFLLQALAESTEWIMVTLSIICLTLLVCRWPVEMPPSPDGLHHICLVIPEPYSTQSQ